ncbi:hypothetical protein [Geodermatophilus marinus]|uniref:hypothetical protein n=1 Tax=Geodermatophilus sp. LHW52908 TaxID=2303986 RepID=UPI000E3D75A3|nr:hypothetical protein [Geodermatophilus sp. LHW52908]RFU20396.1 hypothetical protein D0Z06_16050 [Geodermatophilus sp. LHW52908]
MTGSAPPPARRSGRATALRLARRTALLCGVALACAGALVNPVPSLLWGVVCAVPVGLAVAALRSRDTTDLPPLPPPAAVALGAGCLPAAAAGAATLGAVGGLAVAALLVLAAVLAGSWLASDLPPLGGTLQPGDEAVLRRALHEMTTEQLTTEWRESGTPSPAGPAAELRRVRLRDLLLDEFAARDPEGTARWLAEGPQAAPERYIRRDAGLGS